MDIVENKNADEKLKNLTLIIYILYLASVFIGVTAIAAIIINYVKKDDVAGTLYESHFRWQIRTFWFGILWAVIGAITAVFFIGFLILIATGIWLLYRMIRGLLALNDGKPIY
ncbi:MAG: DUF4870 family protein [Paenalcaligenes sp.]|uniref:hypothetical protein n=1 Tax=Paenalcaligenes suwonensis TaxID=1202713 RepID=UPI00140AB1C8|nr:hypothetical protein [Paenalcaligenes suwonensis]